MKNNQSLICVGKIVAAHGIKGQLKIHSYTEKPKNITSYGDISDDRGNTLKISIVGGNKEILIANINGINDRTEAEKLVGRELFVAKDSMPEAGEGEYYHNDLIGLEARDSAARKLGKVAGIYNFGAGDILEIEFNDGKKKMFIFDGKTVVNIDVKSGFMEVNLPKEVVVEG